MADLFLELPDHERELLLRRAETDTGRSTTVLEKDVWVCWTLEKLFAMPGRQPMVFKGGTSLSKVYNAIARFSEDIDVTLDWRVSGVARDPFALSRSQREKERKTIEGLTRSHVANVVRPYFESALTQMIRREAREPTIEGTAGDKLRILYPSAVPPSGYLGEGILLEFGGRNSLTPHEERDVEPYIKPFFPELHFPVAETVPVLSPMRTFWEKITLVHSECNRPGFRGGKDRMFRHWYDLATLADHEIGRKALADRVLLEDVVKYKQALYHASYSRYEACLQGRAKLVPDEDALSGLKKDFDEMKAKSMFDGNPPSFERLMARVQELAKEINQT